ncbi:MAG: transposase [Gammaproteobacteria bacterium]
MSYGDQAANWQPHLHALVTAGVVDGAGAFTPLPLPPAAVAEALFRARVIARLRQRGRLEDEAAAGLLAWRHSGFSVHSAIRVAPWDVEGKLGEHVPFHIAEVEDLLPMVLLAIHSQSGGVVAVGAHGASHRHPPDKSCS